MTAGEIRRLIRTRWPQAAIYTADSGYLPLSPADLNEFLAVTQVDRLRYQAEGRDCDDFALALVYHARLTHHWGGVPALGEAWGYFHWLTDAEGRPAYHACNLAVLAGPELVLIEPQSDDIHRPDPADRVMWVRL